jgi:NAD(P)H-dependent FMN reductase
VCGCDPVLQMPTLQIIVASTRPGRVGLPVADWFAARAKAHGAVEVDFVDLADDAMLTELDRVQAALRPLREPVAT